MENCNWIDIEDAFHNLFKNEWYTNHGPLANEFENSIQNLTKTKNAICITNASIALIMAIEAIKKNIPPIIIGDLNSNAFNALNWCNLNTNETNKNAGFILSSCNNIEKTKKVIDFLEKNERDLIIDLTSNSKIKDLEYIKNSLDKFEEKNLIMIVLSFHKGQSIEAQNSACILTNNNDVAEKLRNIRSSYGIRKPIKVSKTANGRISEAQALYGIISIKNYNLKNE